MGFQNPFATLLVHGFVLPCTTIAKMADNEAGSGAAPINTGLIEHEIEAIEVDTTVMPPYLLYIETI
jgi:hypothetical protein